MSVAAELGIHHTLISRWIRRYGPAEEVGSVAPAAPRPPASPLKPVPVPHAEQAAEIARLKRENERLRMERDILKKGDRHLCQPVTMRFRFIADHRTMWPVRVMCAVLQVSISGYYAWRRRPESQRVAANRTLLDEICQVHAASQGRYGSPRVHAALKARGHRTGRGRVERLMRVHGVRGLLPRPRRVCTTNSRHAFPIAPDLLGRQFTATAPDQVWLADLTYIATGEGWLYPEVFTVNDLIGESAQRVAR
jgi:hypothetical protein